MLRRFLPLAALFLLPSASAQSERPCQPLEASDEIRISGPSVRVGERAYLGPATRLEAAGAPAGPWPDGEQKLEAAGRCVSFFVDAQPPAIRWETADAARGERGRARYGMPRRASSEDLRAPGLSWPLSHPEGLLRWNPAWASAPAGTVHETVEVVSDLPEAFLRLQDVRLVTPEGTVPPLREGQVLRLRAEDGESRVERMVLRTRTAADGPVLEVQALDGVGNVGRLEWRMETTDRAAASDRGRPSRGGNPPSAVLIWGR